MTTVPSPAKSRRVRLAVTALAVVLLMASCGDDGDKGDPEAFCGLLVQGFGAADGDVEASEFETLAAVAPSEVSSAVDKLRNTTSDVATLDDTDLEALFEASFDPDATEAWRELEAYAVGECDIAVDQNLQQAEVDDFLAINFADTRWVGQVDVEVSTEAAVISTIEVRFLTRPLSGDAVEACQALAVYSYEVAGGEGPVRVFLDEKLLVSREGPDTTCQRP
jgi:hypothetical protein